MTPSEEHNLKLAPLITKTRERHTIHTIPFKLQTILEHFNYNFKAIKEQFALVEELKKNKRKLCKKILRS